MNRTAVLGLAVCASVVLGGARAGADPLETTATARAPRTNEHRHALYVELFGKGGLWGVGYDYALLPRLSIGGAASYMAMAGEHVLSLSPYLAVYPLGGRRHRWFVHAGPQIVHLERPSPVPEWPGTSSTGVGAEVSTGYELRTRVLFRAFAMGTAGKEGVSPWLGVSVGVTL